MIRINEQQCKTIASKLALFSHFKEKSLSPYKKIKDKRKLANYWFFLTAICYKTGNLKGIVNGEMLRGWDFLEAKARAILKEDPEFFLAENLVSISSNEIAELTLDYRDRIEQRCHLLKNCAQMLLERYKGNVMNLYYSTKGNISGQKGVLSLLSDFEAYKDPLNKKSFLLIMTLFKLGVWNFKDEDAIKLPVDNHLMRISLRSGMLEIEDIHLRGILCNQKDIDSLLESKIRSKVLRCGDLLKKHSDMNIIQIDSLLWQIGRNCCLNSHPPFCGNYCCLSKDECSLCKAFSYRCNGLCPLDGACKASRDRYYSKYFEPISNSHYY